MVGEGLDERGRRPVRVERRRLAEVADAKHAPFAGRLRLSDEPEDEWEDGDAKNPEPA